MKTTFATLARELQRKEDILPSEPKPRGVRARTLDKRALKREPVEKIDPELLAELEAARPKHRGECVNGERPCPFVSCEHHLFLDVNMKSGSVKFNFPDKEVWELENSCALDVADRGGITLDEVGAILNLTRERVRQVEALVLDKLRVATGEEPLDPANKKKL